MGKLVEENSFTPPIEWVKPPCTESADVEENIVHWRKNSNTSALENFCRPDNTRPHQYRFVTAEDHMQILRRDKVINGVLVYFKFTRRYHTKDHFCPLYFSHWYTTIVYTINGFTEGYVSDAQLKRDIKLYK